MKRSLVIYSIIIWLFSVQELYAQSSPTYNFNFQTYTTMHGLADNVVVKAVKDKYGFVWLATHNGISRFDGLHFKSYSHNPKDSSSLRSIWVSDLLIDQQQTLWATTEWGLCYYDEPHDQFVYINQKKDFQLLYKMPLCQGTDHVIWVAAEDGLKKVNTLTKTFENTVLNRIADPQFVVHQGNGMYLIGTRGRGLFQFNSQQNRFQEIHVSNLPGFTHFMDAKADKDGLWVATDAGLLFWQTDGKMQVFSNGIDALKGQQAYQLMCLQHFPAAFGEQYLICGTYDKKLFLFDKCKKGFVYQWLPNSANPNGYTPAINYSLLADEQHLFMGTDNGLKVLDLKNQQRQVFLIPALSKGTEQIFVHKALADASPNGNLVWMIPWDDYYGLLLYDREKNVLVNEWRTVKKGVAKKYMDIIQSSDGKLIACRDSAIDFFSVQAGFIKSIPLPSKTYCLVEDAEANFWIGGDKGLILLEVKTGKTTRYDGNFIGTDVEKNSFGEKFPVVDIRLSNSKTLWLANSKYGLFSFDITQKTFTPHRQSFSTAYSTLNRCSSVEYKNDDSVWVGNMAGLSCFLPAQNKFINYDMGSGLTSAYIYSLVKDNSHKLWLRGNADIGVFNTSSAAISSNKLQPTADILSFEQRLVYTNGQVYLGHSGGFSIFDARQSEVKIEKPRIHILSCHVNNLPFYFQQDSISKFALQLTHAQNEISFDFTAIEFNQPEEIEYWYFLEGMDKAWNNGGENRTINYNNLAPGSYRFQVYALNKQFHTKSEMASCMFVIQPAIWQRWWFWPLLGLLFIAFVVFVARKRISEIQEKEKQKTAVNKMMAELETKMLRSQMNPHFIFNSLNSVQKYIWENKEEDAAEYLASFAKLIRAILENSSKEFISLQEELKVMKLYVELEHRRSNAHFDYAIKIDPQIDQEKVQIPPLLLQPFIENAIWHGLNKKATKGHLQIDVQLVDEQLICIIDDDGVGRQPAPETTVESKKSLGIEITQQRINRLMQTTQQMASVQILDKKENGLAVGTTVTIQLPLRTI